jgi:hypothetical protein
MRVLVVALVGVVSGCAQVWGIHNTSAKCGPDQTSCDGVCVDTLGDHDNCGMCGHACGATEVCGNGACGAACPIDQMDCSGTCSDIQSDPMNCNGCGMACASGDVCVFGECQPPCDMLELNAIITDPWGVSWDGLERAPAALDAAQVMCQAFGGRLPTATELYRVAANQSGAVGMSFQTNPLWSTAPVDALDQATIKLSDGTFTRMPATTPTAFRCVCPAALPRTFTSTHCNGDPASPCFEFKGYNVDAKDRPALPRGAANFECITDRAHMVDAPQLAEAILAGLPGSGAAVMTADQWIYSQSTQLVWTGVATGFELGGALTAIDNTVGAPFRCAATKQAQSPNANSIADVFYPKVSKYVGETMDQASVGLVAANDACFARGGHLPRSGELAEMISQGLPNGSNNSLWTSDQTGFNGTNFLVAVNNWSGLDQRYYDAYTGGAAGQTLTWDYKNQAHGYRCIWYPLDPMYVSPTGCTGGCFEVDLPGNPVAKMWFDSMDRNAALPADAIADCAASDGHLTSERDLTEGIRAGLPNGTGAMATPYVWTSDIAQGNITVAFWTATEPTFDDQWQSAMTWANVTTPYRYRCMWTNELR